MERCLEDTWEKCVNKTSNLPSEREKKKTVFTLRLPPSYFLTPWVVMFKRAVELRMEGVWTKHGDWVVTWRQGMVDMWETESQTCHAYRWNEPIYIDVNLSHTLTPQINLNTSYHNIFCSFCKKIKYNQEPV